MNGETDVSFPYDRCELLQENDLIFEEIDLVCKEIN